MKKQNLLIPAVLSLLLVSCLSWVVDNPSFALRGVDLRPLSLTEMNVLFDVEVQNPNRFDLTLNSFEYTIYLNGEEIGNGHLENELVIPSSSTTRVKAPVAARFKDWNKTLKILITGNGLVYKIEGKAGIQAFFGSRNFPFSQEGQLNLK
jgi:LEA14-like dessication related protein